MRKPNLYIIGAAKCGTTALHSYLSTHKEIFMSDPKEPCFWSKDLPGHQKVKTLHAYEQIFCGAGHVHKIVGEASPFYVYSEVAVKQIYEYTPHAKIIVMFRNPVQQAPSFHNQLRLDGNEEIDDFESAWDIQAERKLGKRIPVWCTDRKLLQYRAVASFGEQYRRLLSVWPKDSIHVILMDDVRENMLGVYKSTLQFLDVGYDGRKEFPVVNESHEHLSPWIGRWLYNPPPVLMALNNQIKRALHIKRTNVRRILVVNKKRPPLHAHFEDRLKGEFRDDIGELSDLLDRDLRHWYE